MSSALRLLRVIGAVECPAMTDKRELRSAMRAERKRLAELDPTAAERAAEHVSQLPQASMVAVYCAIGSELDAETIGRVLTEQGRALCLPVVVAMDEAMIFRRWSPGDPLEADAAGVPAPFPLAERVTPDLIMTPLLAFDETGGRLGQGGGYYDRTFAALPDSIRIGLAYAGQEVGMLELEAHDVRLHGVMTEVGYQDFD